MKTGLEKTAADRRGASLKRQSVVRCLSRTGSGERCDPLHVRIEVGYDGQAGVSGPEGVTDRRTLNSSRLTASRGTEMLWRKSASSTRGQVRPHIVTSNAVRVRIGCYPYPDSPPAAQPKSFAFGLHQLAHPPTVGHVSQGAVTPYANGGPREMEFVAGQGYGASVRPPNQEVNRRACAFLANLVCLQRANRGCISDVCWVQEHCERVGWQPLVPGGARGVARNTRIAGYLSHPVAAFGWCAT